MKAFSLTAVAAGAALLVACGLHAARTSSDRSAGRTASARSHGTKALPGPIAAVERNAAQSPSRAASLQAAEPRRAPAPTLSAGMRFDPGTGERGAGDVAQQHERTIEELQKQARQEAEGLVTVRHPDGSESIEHEGRFMDVLVMRTGPDGKPVLSCAHGAYGVHDILRSRPARPALEEE